MERKVKGERGTEAVVTTDDRRYAGRQSTVLRQSKESEGQFFFERSLILACGWSEKVTSSFNKVTNCKQKNWDTKCNTSKIQYCTEL